MLTNIETEERNEIFKDWNKIRIREVRNTSVKFKNLTGLYETLYKNF